MGRRLYCIAIWNAAMSLSAILVRLQSLNLNTRGLWYKSLNLKYFMYGNPCLLIPLYIPQSCPYVSLVPRPFMCKLIYCTWNARVGYFRVHALDLIGSLWSYCKCSLLQFVSEIQYLRIDKRRGVTAFNLLCMYMKWQTGNWLVECSV
jgi:hypothetical protein